MATEVTINGRTEKIFFAYRHAEDNTSGAGRGLLTATLGWIECQDGTVVAVILRTGTNAAGKDDNPSKEFARKRIVERFTAWLTPFHLRDSSQRKLVSRRLKSEHRSFTHRDTNLVTGFTKDEFVRFFLHNNPFARGRLTTYSKYVELPEESEVFALRA